MPLKLKMRFIAAVAFAMSLSLVVTEIDSQSQPPKSSSQAASISPADIQKKIEAYLRFSFALGPNVKLTIGPLAETPVPGLYKVTVEVASPDSPSDVATFYVSRDGRYLVRAELEDMNADPFAENRKLISLSGTPSKGPTDAKVVLVEYADFECPSCKQLDMTLRSLLAQFPEVRLLYKNFPLADIHPWAMTAAEAGQCAFKQNPQAFWAFHDLIFEGQGFISAENVVQKMQDYATEAGLDPIALRSCISAKQSTDDVRNSIAEGQALHITQTPTIFVNGRRLIAPDSSTLEQYVGYERSGRFIKSKIY